MNTTLQRVSLSDNYVGEKGGLALAQALTKNASVQALYLKGNELGDVGVSALCEALQVRHGSACVCICMPTWSYMDLHASMRPCTHTAGVSCIYIRPCTPALAQT